MPRSRLILFTGIALLLTGFLLFAFWPRAVLVDLAPAERGLMAVTIREEARADHRADLKRMAALREAEAVAQRDYEAELRAVRSSEAALAAAKANVAAQEAELERALALLMAPDEAKSPMTGNPHPEDALPVRAPVSGLVLQVIEESEGIVQPGTPLMEIGNPQADLRIVAELLSSDAVAVEPGDPVLVEAWGGPPLDAVVDRVEPWGFAKYSALGVEEQRVRVTMRLLGEEESHARLGHGYRAEVRIAVWQEDDVLRIPSSALFRAEGAWAVFKMQNGRAALTPVEIGKDNGDKAQVLSGLSEGDLVLTYPASDVRPGAKVKPRADAG